MRKNIFLTNIIVIVCTIIILPVKGEKIGIGDIIYTGQQTTTQENRITAYTISSYTVQQHIQLSSSTIPESPEGEQLLQNMEKIHQLLQTHIIQEMEMSEDKEKTLQNYIQECEKAITVNKQNMIYLQQLLPLLKIELNTCTNNKLLADKQYFESINTYKVQDSEFTLQQAITYDRCASEKRIQYNAKSYIVSKLAFYISTLQTKQELISNNQDMIINHLESIRTDILEKLTNIDKLLQSYTF